MATIKKISRLIALADSQMIAFVRIIQGNRTTQNN